MKAVQYFEHSADINKVVLNTIDKPVLIHPGTALIKVYAASINPADTGLNDFRFKCDSLFLFNL